MDRIINKIEEERAGLTGLCLDIHRNPEVCFKEFHASKVLRNYLDEQGFDIKDHVAAMETAFVAHYKSDKAGPTIAYLAEYDALPGIGHGCGHNLIAAMSVGAAVGLRSVIDEIGGTVKLIGTPAEEGGGGKILMCNEGIFDDVDCAMMIHPSTENLIMRGGLATRSFTVEYQGKSAHSASPESGINALNAVIQTFNLIDTSRPLMPTGANVNGMIIKGGTATNIIADSALCKFSVRATDISDLKKVTDIIERVVDSVDVLIGTKSKITLGLIYAERYPNRPMAETLKSNVAILGETMNYPDPKMKVGSSDVGNVSLLVPTIHSYLRIADEDVKSHSLEFTEIAGSDFALDQMIKGAKALAMTGRDILSSRGLQEEMVEYFNLTVPQYSKEDME